MNIKRQLDILDTLDGHIPESLYDAINAADIVEQEVEIEICGFCPGRPAKTYGPPECCYPADPAEWDEEPAEDYGCRVLSRLLAKAATCEPLRKELLRHRSNEDVLATIREVVNRTIEAWDNSQEVYAEVEAQREAAAEYRAEMRIERAENW